MLCSHDSMAGIPSLLEYSVGQTVSDVAIEIDNLITKLLKVLRYVQIDNDGCIQQLITDKLLLLLRTDTIAYSLKLL